jgi:predicted metalloendopeptidase
MRITLAALCAATALAVSVRAEIDPANFDTSVSPTADFYRYANGGWMDRNPVPPEYSRWGSFNVLQQQNLDHLHALAEEAAAKGAAGSPMERMVGDFYASGMDQAAIDAAGASPLRPEFDRIAGIRTRDDVLAEIAHLHTIGVGAGFGFHSGADDKDSSMEIAQLSQGGLGLGERDYYFRDDEKSKALRAEYVAHVARMLQLLGDTPQAAQAGAGAVMTLETALAKASLNRVVLRNPYASYHKMKLAAAAAQFTPDMDWHAFLASTGAPAFDEVNFAHPEFFKAFDAELVHTPIADWQTYLRWHLIHAFAPFLSSDFEKENFAFYDTTMNGVKEMPPRWKRVVQTIDRRIGDALGQLYVARYFPPEAKVSALKLVGNLRASLHDRIEALSWMDDATKAKAIAKLDAFTVKIGYPDKWKDYGTLTIDRGPYVLDAMRAAAYESHRNLRKIGGPVDKAEWGMTPPTVNAYYNPSRNEIVFPAGILQPPFFDPKQDDAVNYGGIGVVIGHEMTHGFDDQGRQYDGAGNLTDWWTPGSASRFKEHAAGIVRQFSGYTVLDGLHLNGEMTQGENIADLGGLKISFAALQKALAGRPQAKIDGFTPEQRFFLSFATIWRENSTPESARQRVHTDPHSPGRFRTNGPLSNLEEFYSAFSVPEGAPMRRPEADRVTIW